MTNKDCVRRLQREYQKLLKEPTSEFVAMPNPDNILEWHYVFDGPQGTPYQGGTYYGRLKFPEQYPHKPPSIMMVTPSGRFIPETRLCLSYSDFHPESWNPMWNVSTILTGLISYMTSTDEGVGTVASTDAVKRAYATASMDFNKKNQQFRKFFESRCREEPIAASSSGTSAASQNSSKTPAPVVQEQPSSSTPRENLPTQRVAQPAKEVPKPAAIQAQQKKSEGGGGALTAFIVFIVLCIAYYLNRVL